MYSAYKYYRKLGIKEAKNSYKQLQKRGSTDDTPQSASAAAWGNKTATRYTQTTTRSRRPSLSTRSSLGCKLCIFLTCMCYYCSLLINPHEGTALTGHQRRHAACSTLQILLYTGFRHHHILPSSPSFPSVGTMQVVHTTVTKLHNIERAQENNGAVAVQPTRDKHEEKVNDHCLRKLPAPPSLFDVVTFITVDTRSSIRTKASI